jgi:quercetin dioxygenase-like cupin family protein
MAWDESNVWSQGELRTDWYERLLKDAAERPERNAGRRRLVKPWEMPWELSVHGLLKHMVNEEMNTLAESIDIYMQVIPGGSRSGKHRHFAEEAFYVVEGSGYDLHWDCDVDAHDDGWHWIVPDEPQRFEWKAGDVVYIPPGSMHQHFNGSSDKPCRIVSATNRIYKWAGLNNLEQFENAPEYDAGQSLDELLERLGYVAANPAD